MTLPTHHAIMRILAIVFACVMACCRAGAGEPAPTVLVSPRVVYKKPRGSGWLRVLRTRESLAITGFNRPKDTDGEIAIQFLSASLEPVGQWTTAQLAGGVGSGEERTRGNEDGSFVFRLGASGEFVMWNGSTPGSPTVHQLQLPSASEGESFLPSWAGCIEQDEDSFCMIYEIHTKVGGKTSQSQFVVQVHSRDTLSVRSTAWSGFIPGGLAYFTCSSDAIAFFSRDGLRTDYSFKTASFNDPVDLHVGQAERATAPLSPLLLLAPFYPVKQVPALNEDGRMLLLRFRGNEAILAGPAPDDRVPLPCYPEGATGDALPDSRIIGLFHGSHVFVKATIDTYLYCYRLGTAGQMGGNPAPAWRTELLQGWQPMNFLSNMTVFHDLIVVPSMFTIFLIDPADGSIRARLLRDGESSSDPNPRQLDMKGLGLRNYYRWVTTWKSYLVAAYRDATEEDVLCIWDISSHISSHPSAD